MTRRRVLLLFGGRSAEHDVSRVTAVAVARALDPEKYEVVPVAITTDGRWLLADGARRQLEAGTAALPPAFAADGQEVGIGGLATGSGSPLAVDVVVPLLHGPYGEDGTVQGLLELADLPYVGSGVVGSAVAMDKVMMRRAFAAAGLAQPRWTTFREGHDRAVLRDEVERFGYPCFVKPANMGSSVGVSKVHEVDALDEAVDRALAFDEWVQVEEGIAGREIEVGILGDDPPEASVPGEILPGDEFYSYADKYEDGRAQLLVPAPLAAGETAEVRALATRAFEACRGEGMARVDLFFEEGGRGFLLNEVNTIPGFTPISMYPRLWEASGVTYATLLDRLIDLAVTRHDRRAKRAGRHRDDA